VDIDMDYPMVVIDSLDAIISADEDKRQVKEIASFARRNAAGKRISGMSGVDDWKLKIPERLLLKKIEERICLYSWLRPF
jgi:hypothetical protein